MKIFLMVLAMMTGTQAIAQNFEISKDRDTKKLIYKGQITFEDLKEQLSFTWMDKGVKEYQPDTNTLKFLQKNLNTYTMTIFLGTWCSDSHNMIPKLYKVMQQTHYPMKQYLMYGVDMEKRSLGGEQKLYNIINVPTVILYKKNHEVGRITEMVHKSIEGDLQAIIEKDQQKH